MKKLILTTVLVVTGIFYAQAQSVTGRWKTIDDETNDAKSIIEITEKNGKIYGKIIEILDPTKANQKCRKCTGEDKDKPILGITVIRGLSKKGNEYTDGKILDPNNGKLYKCTVSLDGNNKLNVRGYIGVSLIGRTQTWIRVK